MPWYFTVTHLLVKNYDLNEIEDVRLATDMDRKLQDGLNPPTA